jgi:protein SCO1/2
LNTICRNAAAVVLAAAVNLILVSQTASAAATIPPSESVYRADVALRDAQSHSFRWDELRGRPRLVSMFYTSCSFVCPMLIDGVKGVLEALPADERARLGVMLISLDPKRDTPAVLGKMQKDRDLDPALWTLAQPNARDVRTIGAVLGIRYRALANGDFNHTTVIVLLDDEGRVVARTDNIGRPVDREFLAAIRKTLAAH